MVYPRSPIASILAVAVLSFSPIASMAETIAVIGTGRMGSAIGPRLAETGHKVIYGSRTPSADKVRELIERSPGKARAATQKSAVAAADIVIVAVPWFATEDFIKQSGPFDGKLILDMSNATTMRDDGLLDLAVDTSAGQLIQSWAPQAKVVKFFNTVSYHVIADLSIARGKVTVPLAGNDAPSKARAAKIVEGLGFEAIDIGPIRNARALEFMSTIHMVPYLTDRWDEAFEYYFVKGTAPTNVDEVRLSR
jgi:predicted dinucleotide-binding enzyme